MKFNIDENSTGMRLDKFLTENLSDLSRSQIQKLIKSGRVVVNDNIVSKHCFLKKGDIIEIKEIKNKEIKEIIEPNIIAKTNNYLVINKPAGLLVHPVKSPTSRGLPLAEFHRVNETENSIEKTLADWLIKKYPKIKNIFDKQNKTGEIRPGIVHRLDRDVSGLMVIAKTQDMFDNLKQQFQSRKIDKEYTALAHGKIELDEGEITRSITRSKKTGLMIARGSNQEQGKNAITKFEVIKRLNNYTLLKIKLITGRTHQIRVHLRSIGHSVVGDSLYQTKDLRKHKIKDELDRIFLCATKLGFYNLDNEWQEFSIGLSEDLTNFLKDIK